MSTNEKRESRLGQGITVELHEPSPDNPRYTAFVEEFAMMGEGDTLDDAIAALFSELLTSLDSFAKAEQLLPPCTTGAPNGDERTDQMNGR